MLHTFSLAMKEIIVMHEIFKITDPFKSTENTEREELKQPKTFFSNNMNDQTMDLMFCQK